MAVPSSAGRPLNPTTLGLLALVAAGQVEAGPCPTTSSHFNAIKNAQMRAAAFQEAQSIDSRLTSPAQAQQCVESTRRSIEQTRHDIAELQTRIAQGRILGPERDQLVVLQDGLALDQGLLELCECRARQAPGALGGGKGLPGGTSTSGGGPAATLDQRASALGSGMEQGMARQQAERDLRAQSEAARAVNEWKAPKGYGNAGGPDPAAPGPKVALEDPFAIKPGADAAGTKAEDASRAKLDDSEQMREDRWKRKETCDPALSICTNGCEASSLRMPPGRRQACDDSCGRDYDLCLAGTPPAQPTDPETFTDAQYTKDKNELFERQRQEVLARQNAGYSAEPGLPPPPEPSLVARARMAIEDWVESRRGDDESPPKLRAPEPPRPTAEEALRHPDAYERYVGSKTPPGCLPEYTACLGSEENAAYTRFEKKVSAVVQAAKAGPVAFINFVRGAPSP